MKKRNGWLLPLLLLACSKEERVMPDGNAGNRACEQVNATASRNGGDTDAGSTVGFGYDPQGKPTGKAGSSGDPNGVPQKNGGSQMDPWGGKGESGIAADPFGKPTGKSGPAGDPDGKPTQESGVAGDPNGKPGGRP